MKTSSAKAKGRLLQQFVKNKVLFMFPHLSSGDVESRSMGANGTDVMLSPLARESFPFAVECKNIAKFSGHKYMKQAEDNAKGEIPLVVVKQNLATPLVILKWDDFEHLVKKGSK